MHFGCKNVLEKYWQASNDTAGLTRYLCGQKMEWKSFKLTIISILLELIAWFLCENVKRFNERRFGSNFWEFWRSTTSEQASNFSMRCKRRHLIKSLRIPLLNYSNLLYPFAAYSRPFCEENLFEWYFNPYFLCIHSAFIFK